MAARTATSTSTTTPPPAPPFGPAGAKWEPHFGYPMRTTGEFADTGIYLGTLHLTALSTAAEGPRCYQPEFGSGTDAIISRELREGGLLDTGNDITDIGRWYLTDRGWA